jgi:hypothetical protein
MPPTMAINAGAPFTLSHPTDHSLSLSKLSLLQRMASNDNVKCKLEEVKSSTMRKRLRPSDNDGGDNDSSDSLEEETEEEEEVSSEKMLMNQLDTSEEKMFAKRTRGSDDDDTTSLSLKPRTPESRWSFDEESSNDDDDDDFLM